MTPEDKFVFRVKRGRGARQLRVEIFTAEGEELRGFLGYMDILPEVFNRFARFDSGDMLVQGWEVK